MYIQVRGFTKNSKQIWSGLFELTYQFQNINVIDKIARGDLAAQALSKLATFKLGNVVLVNTLQCSTVLDFQPDIIDLQSN